MFDQPEDSCRLKSPCLGRHERLSEPLQQKVGLINTREVGVVGDGCQPGTY